MTSKTVARVYLVRHGETQANRDGVIQGQQDTALNELGEEQARLVGEALKGVKFGYAFSSDLSRAVKTAEAILAHHPEVKLVKQQELRERFMGDLEGTSGKWAKLVLATGADQSIETSAAFSQRAMAWWKERILGHVLDTRPDDGEEVNVLVTSHGGWITTLVRDLIGARKAQCGEGVMVSGCFNASVSVIEVKENKKGVVVAYGDIQHLSDALEFNADVDTT
ncbi:phosphoglycerate mutase-like protein [Flammula alnicola]|nr:phosphoglycerate mutase-like protein [Flammula alnicola]